MQITSVQRGPNQAPCIYARAERPSPASAPAQLIRGQERRNAWTNGRARAHPPPLCSSAAKSAANAGPNGRSPAPTAGFHPRPDIVRRSRSSGTPRRSRTVAAAISPAQSRPIWPPPMLVAVVSCANTAAGINGLLTPPVYAHEFVFVDLSLTPLRQHPTGMLTIAFYQDFEISLAVLAFLFFFPIQCAVVDRHRGSVSSPKAALDLCGVFILSLPYKMHF